MPTVAERVSVVEVQIANLDEKLDEIKVDVKEMHDCLDRTGDRTQTYTQRNAQRILQTAQ
jgi:hypothetical protein